MYNILTHFFLVYIYMGSASIYSMLSVSGAAVFSMAKCYVGFILCLSRHWSYLSPILNLMDAELHRDVEAVENVPAKHQRVLRGVHSMDPPWKTDTHKQTNTHTYIHPHTHNSSFHLHRNA